jgi:hypothetical protein
MSIGDIHKTSKIITIPTRIYLFPTNQSLMLFLIEHNVTSKNSCILSIQMIETKQMLNISILKKKSF